MLSASAKTFGKRLTSADLAGTGLAGEAARFVTRLSLGFPSATRRTASCTRENLCGCLSVMAIAFLVTSSLSAQSPSPQYLLTSPITATAGESASPDLSRVGWPFAEVTAITTIPPLQFPPRVDSAAAKESSGLRIVIPPATPAGEYKLQISGRDVDGNVVLVAMELTVKALTLQKSSNGRLPVILLNGFQLLCTSSTSTVSASEGTFGQLGPLLEADGAPVAFFNNCAYGDITIENLAFQLKAYLGGLVYSDGTPVTQVDLVGHSMGGLIVRAYLSGLQTDATFSPPSSIGVRKFIEIATPNFGSFIAANFPFGTQVSEMIPASAFLWNLGTWNQWGDDLRGVDALAIIGNGGTFGNTQFASDGVVSLTSASLEFARDPSRTKIVPYCHIDSSSLNLLIGAVYCVGAGIADVDNAPQTGQIIRSFLADTNAWMSIGTSPNQDPFLSVYGGLEVTLSNSTGQYLKDVSRVNWGSIALQNGGASNSIYYGEFLKGTGTMQYTSNSLGNVSCGSITQPPGYVDLFRCKYGPIVNRVAPIIQGMVGTSVKAGATITISGSQFGTQCSGCQVVAYPGNIPLSISSWSDQAIVTLLPSTISGFVELLVTASGGSGSITMMVVTPPIISLSNNQIQFSYDPRGTSPQVQLLQVLNSGGGGVLLWSAIPSASWIVLDETSSLSLTVAVNPTGLAPGIYKGSIQVIAPGAKNTPQAVSITLTVVGGAATSVIVTSVANSASGAVGAVAPGEIITIKGSGLGPTTGFSFGVNPKTGTVDSTLAGTQVFFGGIAAPILYASSVQINAVAPYEVAGQSQVVMQVSYQGVSSTGTTLSVAPSAPGVFTFSGSGVGQAVAANQNGTFNGPANPAPAGSFVTVYFTGGGQTVLPGVTGSVTGPLLKWFIQGISVTVGGQPASVAFDGSAPGFVDGVGQLNIKLASNTPSGAAIPVVVTVAGVRSSASATLSVSGTTTFSTVLGAGRDGNLYGVVPDSGATVFIGRLPAVMSDVASFNGLLYGISAPTTFGSSVLYSINPNTGGGTVIGDTGVALNALVFGADGTLYGAGSDSLYAISPSTGSSTLLGSGTGPGTYNSSGDLAFDGAGKLYLTSSGSSSGDKLLSLDPSTGQGVAIGNTGFTNVYGLVYLNGTMYGFSIGGQVVTINLSTGAAALVASYLPGFNGTTLFSVTGPASPLASLPIITSVSQITASQNQTLTIQGSGFGSMKAYSGDSSYIEVTDLTSEWNAGYTSDSVTLNITSWTDSQIIIQGLQGAYGQSGWVLKSGDQVEIQIVNPQAGTGPAIFVATVH